MRPEVAYQLVMWFGLMLVGCAVVIGALVWRIHRLEQEVDGLAEANAQLGREVAAARHPSRRPSARDRQAPTWPAVDRAAFQAIVADFHHPSPPGFPDRERLDGGDVL